MEHFNWRVIKTIFSLKKKSIKQVWDNDYQKHIIWLIFLWLKSKLLFQKYAEEASESTSEKSRNGHLMVPSKKNSTVGLHNCI